MALDPGQATYHSNLGAALRGLGRLDEAEAALRRALRREPDRAESPCRVRSMPEPPDPRSLDSCLRPAGTGRLSVPGLPGPRSAATARPKPLAPSAPGRQPGADGPSPAPARSASKAATVEKPKQRRCFLALIHRG